MAEINDLTTVDASNTARWPENMPPSDVNDAGRSGEGILARWHRDLNGSVTTTGTSTAYVYAANQTLTAYYDGLMLGVDFHTASGASPTINVDSLGAKSLVWPDGTAVAASEIATDQKAVIVYDGTNFQVITEAALIGAGKIADNAITLAKMAHGTQGGVLYYGASGAPTELAAGTSGQVLSTQGAGANPQWADAASKVSVYDFTDTADTSISTAVPTGTLWSASQAITIPTNGVIIIYATARFDNASGSNRTYNIGLRINGTDYFDGLSSNGTEVYVKTSNVATGEYRIIRGGLQAGETTGMFDVVGRGISTGSQTVQPIVAADASTATQTLKGTVVTARLKVIIFDMS